MMNITTAEIKYLKKGGFQSSSCENLKRVKILPYLSIVQSVEGSYDIALGNGNTYQTGENGFFIAPSNVQQTITHHVNPKSGTMVSRWLFLDVEINKIYKLDALYLFPVLVDDTRKQALHALLNRIFEREDVWDNYACAYQILSLLFPTATPVKNLAPHGVQKAILYIKEQYNQPITVQQLSKIATMSEPYFYASFKKYFGCSPIAYLNHYRLSIAANKLIESKDTVGSIACDVGISDPLYFSKLFKKAYHLSPIKYRETYKQN